jgi:hypothetical protein
MTDPGGRRIVLNMGGLQWQNRQMRRYCIQFEQFG